MTVRTRLEAAERQRQYEEVAARTAVAPEDERAARLKNNSDSIKQQNLEFFFLHAEMSAIEKEIVTKRLELDHLASPDVAWSLLQKIRAESCVLAQILVGKPQDFQQKVFAWMERHCTAEEKLGLDGGAKCRYARNLVELDGDSD